jgi:hypothetical protein
MEISRRSTDRGRAHNFFTTSAYGPGMSARQSAAAGLCAVSVGVLVVLAAGGVFVPAGLAFGLVPLAGAALLLIRSRWMPLLAAILGAVFLFGALHASATAARLADPGSVLPFAASLLQLAGAAVAAIAGAVATIRPPD